MLRRILTHYNNWKLGKKLLFAFILVSIIPILAIQAIAYNVNKASTTEKINQLMVNNLTQISERVNLCLEVYTNLLYQMYMDEQIIDNIKILLDDHESRKAVAYNQIYNRLKQYNNSDEEIRCISVVCNDGNSVVYDFETDSSMDNLWRIYDDLRNVSPYIESVDKPGMVITPTMKFRDKEERKSYFHISKRIFDFSNLEQGSIATITMSVDENLLNAMCNSRENQDLSEYSMNFIMSEDRRVITYPDEDFSGISMNPDLSIEEFVKVSGFLKDRQTAVNMYEDPVSGWIFVNVYDRDYMLKDIEKMQIIFVSVGIAAIIFAGIFIIYTVRTLNRSVKSVVKGMESVQGGNLDVVVPMYTVDEIGIIARNFNLMTTKVKRLLHEVGLAKDKQKDAEIRALEAQINPHFLYNTLDSINWMAIEKEEYQISKMLRNLGVILRYSINKSNQMATIWEVSDWLSKYISLHQMRFNDAFSYYINTDPGTHRLKIHKLLLQPFIENAILHGFKEMDRGGLLRIDITMSEDKKGLAVIIEDNGKGMPASLVQTYNNREEAIRVDGRSIGVHNAFSRMNIYYGENARWNVSSVEGIGTVITLYLPVTGEMPEGDNG